MIKKTLLLILVISLVSGCGMALDVDKNKTNNSDEEKKEGEVQTLTSKDDSSSKEFSNEYKTILMENVERSDILLHKKTAFTQLEFYVRDNTSLSAGKDIYKIGYLSNAKPKEIYDAYIDYIDEVTEESANDYNLSIEGFVNGLPISVSVELNELMDIKGSPVRITISEDPSKFQEENRYFNEYPDLVELYKVKKDGLYHRTIDYTESYLDDVKTYRIAFATAADENDFTSYYTENYGNKSNFESEEDEYQKQFSWSDSGFEHKLVLQKSNGMASLYVKAPLP